MSEGANQDRQGGKRSGETAGGPTAGARGAGSRRAASGTPASSISTGAASTGQGAWSPVMTTVVVGVCSFFAGIFLGSEMHHPVVAPAAPAMPAASSGAAAPDAGAASSGADATGASVDASGADSSAMRSSIESTSDVGQLQALGEAHLDTQPDVAVLAFQRALKIGPPSAALYRGLGLAEIRLKQLPDAMKDLKKALALNPHDVTSVLGIGLIQEKLPGGAADARKSFSKALTMNPPDQLKASIEGELKRLGGS